MSKTKHTPGPWYYNGDEGSETGKFGHNVNTARGVIADIAECGAATEHNARLIAEAGTVAHETGLWPRRLAEDRTALTDALWRLINCHTGAAWQTEEVQRAAWINAAETVEKARRPM